jgi:hypothetical protein
MPTAVAIVNAMYSGIVQYNPTFPHLIANFESFYYLLVTGQIHQ